MGRYSYDDMPPEGYKDRSRSSGRMTAAIASIGVLLTLIAIIIYLLFTPHNDETVENGAVAESVTVTPVEPVIIESKAEIPEVQEESPAITEPVYVSASYEKASDNYQKLEFREHRVAEGENLLTIAESYSLSSDTLVSVNQLSDTELTVGSVLIIPPVDCKLRIVLEGDTLASIAENYNPELSAADLAALNGKAYTAVYPGEEIFIPSPGTVESGETYLFSSPIPGGKVIARFGELVEGEPLKGVVIASAPGTAVRAAADGTVLDIFSHPAFGRSITLLHDNGYTTEYYSLEYIAVKVSQRVSEGDVIGTIGTSSKFFDEPAVVYSVDQHSVPLDPMNLTEF